VATVLLLGIAIGIVLVRAALWIARRRSAARAQAEVPSVEHEMPSPLMVRRDEQIQCLEEYLVLATELVGKCPEMEEIPQSHTMPRDRVTAAERYAEQRAAGLYGRACLALGGNLAADMLDALCAGAAARFDADVLESELRARQLHEQCQRDIIAAIHQTERTLGLTPKALPVESAAVRRGRNDLQRDRSRSVERSDRGRYGSSPPVATPIEIEVSTESSGPSHRLPTPPLAGGGANGASHSVSSAPPSTANTRSSRVVSRLAAIANAANDSLRPPSGFREYHVATESQPPRGVWSVIMDDGSERLVAQAELEELWRAGKINEETSVRKEGMASFARLGLFREFRRKQAE